tara:strand:+ start:106 stop:870 length:765 start_codon:yes stop_codon:yes gene_type:complete
MNILTTENYLDETINKLDNDGFVSIENILEKELIEAIKIEILEILKKKGNPKYLSISNPLKKDYKSFEKLQKDINIIDFIEKLTKKYLPKYLDTKNIKDILKKEDIYSVLRIVSGNKTSMAFHYDKTLITVLIPISIPKVKIQDSGHLITFKNKRKVRKSSLLNFLEKAMIQNKITKKFFANKTINSKNIQIMKEGNIYLFNGYRTLHGNFPVIKNEQRMTLLLHFANPHINSKLLKSISFLTTFIQKTKGELT